jgi:hypothetical protein
LGKVLTLQSSICPTPSNISLLDSNLIKMLIICLTQSHIHLMVFSFSFFHSILYDMDTYLCFGSAFNRRVINLPPSLAHLTFGNRFDKPVDHLPAALTHLTFSNCFNNPVDHLPSSLKHLTLSSSFEYPVDSLPNLETLAFAGNSHFNQKIDLLPQTLTVLKIGKGKFNHRIPLLPHLTKLTISANRFNQPLDLPPSLHTLRLRKRYNQPLPELLSPLSTLRCRGEIIPNIPPTLTFLQCLDPCPKTTIDLLRNSSLSHLLLEGRHFNEPIHDLPPTLKQLSLGNAFNQDLDNLPNSLTSLSFAEYSDFYAEIGRLPEALTHLTGWGDHRLPLLPPNLTHLSFPNHSRFNKSLNARLPATLKSLELGFYYHKQLILPPSVTELTSNINCLLACLCFPFFQLTYLP